MAEIEALKRQVAGRDVVESVVRAHTAFEKKSVFSKQKYLLRKEQKFLKRFTPTCLGSSELIEYFAVKEPHRILEMTAESLGLMLSLADVKPGGTYMVVDETSGLLVAAMLERMAGEGRIVVVHENEHPNFDLLKFTNFPAETTDRMVTAMNLLQLYHPEEEEEVRELSAETLAGMKSARRGQYYKRLRRQEELRSIFSHVDGGAFDGLLLATTLDTSSLLQKMIPCVRGSRPIVLYNASKEPLVTTAHELLGDLRVLAPTIMETRVRNYQVLPGRTHPQMTSKSGGGYLLSGTRVLPSTDARAGGVRKKRKVEPAAPAPDTAMADASEAAQAAAA
ncbi:Gcd10p family-domain-containing protein [Dipodascopsis tothii]|uniref:Gcd10p family-domain-containing protein n=1 Tax=Dipodascopsis tothii TaxID=44089 RepID=UPI0034CD5D0B